MSGLSGSDAVDKFSVDFMSEACDQKHQESINKTIIYPTPPDFENILSAEIIMVLHLYSCH